MSIEKAINDLNFEFSNANKCNEYDIRLIEGMDFDFELIKLVNGETVVICSEREFKIRAKELDMIKVDYLIHKVESELSIYLTGEDAFKCASHLVYKGLC